MTAVKSYAVKSIYTDCFKNRISKFKENLPSCTLNVILFPEQRVEIRTFSLSQTLIS